MITESETKRIFVKEVNYGHYSSFIYTSHSDRIESIFLINTSSGHAKKI